MTSPQTSYGFARTDDGADISWRSFGEGSPLLLIGGQRCTHKAWLHLVPSLSASHRVIIYDARGFGTSSPGQIGGITTQDLAKDACAVLDSAGERSAAVYGHSMGGKIAQWLTLNHPERVDRLVLTGTSGGNNLVPRDRETISPIMRSTDILNVKSKIFFSEEFRKKRPDVVMQFFDGRSTPEIQSAHFLASVSHDTWDELHRITAPTLVVHGGGDVITLPGNAHELTSRIPGSRLHMEPDGLHCVHLESPVVQKVVEDFLAS